MALALQEAGRSAGVLGRGAACHGGKPAVEHCQTERTLPVRAPDEVMARYPRILDFDRVENADRVGEQPTVAGPAQLPGLLAAGRSQP